METRSIVQINAKTIPRIRYVRNHDLFKCVITFRIYDRIADFKTTGINVTFTKSVPAYERLDISSSLPSGVPSLCPQKVSYGGQCREFWSFSRGSPVSSILSHKHTPIFNLPPMLFHIHINSFFHLMLCFTSFIVRKSSLIWCTTGLEPYDSV